MENRNALAAILSKECRGTICVSRLSECLELLASDNIEFVFCDWQLTDGTYRDLLAVLRAIGRRANLVVASRLADWDEYLEAMEHGAFWAGFNVISWQMYKFFSTDFKCGANQVP